MKKFTLTHAIIQSVNTLATFAPKLAGKIAFFLFCKPKKKEPKTVEHHFLATADLTYETVNHRRYAIWHWGFKGPTALLVHGWESHSGRWRKMVPILLNAGYQVVAVDAPAHGRSSGNRFTMVEYAEIIRYLLQKHAPVDLVIGHSVGATSVVWALSNTGVAFRPRKAVLLAPFTSLRYTMERSSRNMHISDTVMQAAFREIEDFAKLPFDDIDITRRVNRLADMETLIIHDRADKVTEYTESVKLHEAWPDSELWITDDFGHGLTAPEVYERIEDYITVKSV